MLVVLQGGEGVWERVFLEIVFQGSKYYATLVCFARKTKPALSDGFMQNIHNCSQELMIVAIVKPSQDEGPRMSGKGCLLYIT